jgi:hypothetical protein
MIAGRGPFVKYVLTRDRFLQVFRMAHESSPIPAAARDKIRNVVDIQRENFRDQYVPGPNLSIV